MQWTFTGTIAYCISGFNIKASVGGGEPDLPWLPVTRSVGGVQARAIASGFTPPQSVE